MREINILLREVQNCFMSTQARQTILIRSQVKLLLKQRLLSLSCRRLVPGSKKVVKCAYRAIVSHFSQNLTFTTQTYFALFHFEAFREILEGRASAHPFENVQSLLPPNSWLALHPIPGKLSLRHFMSSVFMLKCLSHSSLCSRIWMLLLLFSPLMLGCMYCVFVIYNSNFLMENISFISHILI